MDVTQNASTSLCNQTATRNTVRTGLFVWIWAVFLLLAAAGMAHAEPSAPTATGGEVSAAVTGFTPGATLKLYLTDGTLVDTAANVTGSEYIFTGVMPNSLWFYVTQTVGGQEGPNSPWFGVTLPQPTLAAGIGYVDAGNILTGATVTLYDLDSNYVSNTPVSQGSGVWRFTPLIKGSSYYVSQSINGVVSQPSAFASVAAPNAPTSAGSEESISVSGFTSGATLKLYLSDGTPVDTANSVSGTEYTFTNVTPDSRGFYATQTVNGAESLNSPWVGATLRTPSAAAGTDYVDVSNVLSGATVSLYDSNGSLISSSPADQGNGVWRFNGLTAHVTYYAQLSLNGVVSSNSSYVTPAPPKPAAPAAAGGEVSVTVSSFTSGATLKLYLTNGTMLATATNVTGAVYTFPNVTPNNLWFYVTQTVNGEESDNSPWFGVTLGTPEAEAGIRYVDVSNVFAGATVTLYDSDGGFISSSPADQGSGVWRFNGLATRKAYYAIQSVNGVDSPASSFATVQAVLPPAPTATGGEESLTVSSFTSGAALKLYLTTGTLLATADSVTDATYSFSNVIPDSRGFYVTQMVDGEESDNSPWFGVSLRTPVISAGTDYVDAGNLFPGAAVILYDSGGSLISDTPADQGNGIWRFGGLLPRTTYYAVQSINGVWSQPTAFATVQPVIPSSPVAAGGEESVVVSGFIPGAALKLYVSDGTLVAAAPNVTDATYTFWNITPNSLWFYVTQTVNGEEGDNSSWVGVTLRTPVLTAGEGYADASHVLAGAVLTLYDMDNQALSSSPVDQGNGIWRFSGLAAGNTYYVIQSINGVSSLNSAFATIPTAPAPAGFTVIPSDQQVTLSWETVTGATYYNVYISVIAGQFDNATAVSVTDTTYTLQNLTNGTTYYFMVKAKDAAGLGLASAELQATPATVPGAPTNVTAAAGDGMAVIRFTPPSDNGGRAIAGYEVISSPGHITVTGTSSTITITGLTNGTSYTFTVRAVNAMGTSTAAESNSVVPASPASDDDSSSSSPTGGESGPSPGNGFEVLVNGKAESAGTVTKSEVNGQSVLTVTVDTKKIAAKLAAEGNNAVITIPVTAEADRIASVLPGALFQQMQKQQAVVVIDTPAGSYTLPSRQILTASVAQQLGTGVQAEDIQLRIEIAKADSASVKTAETAAQQGGFRLAAPLMEFSVTAVYNGRTVAIESFSAYVERTIALPAGTDSNSITTGVVIEEDGSTRHVPTKITSRNGTYYAQINSLTNSSYTVVWHPLEFADVNGHWAKTDVNDMGSRMVIHGISEDLFAPDQDITRAEFAAVVVRALGLKPGAGTGRFMDVQGSDWYAPVVKTAAGYGLISGYEDGTFRPNAKITREEAMVLVSRAMKLTGLSAAGSSPVLAEYSDAAKLADWAKEAAAASISTGLVSGRNQAELAPQEMITRAETAVIIRRLLKESDLIS